MLQDIFLFFLPFILFFLFWFFSKKPTNKRNWRIDLIHFTKIRVNNEKIFLEDIRDFKYGETEYDYISDFKDLTFSLEDIVSLDYIIEPFMRWSAISHPLLSFGLKNGKHIVISVEVRKRKGFDYSIFKSFFRGYELFYLISTEDDTIKLRTHQRKNPVYLFPLEAEKSFIQELFLDMLYRAKKLQKTPEFYHPWFNSCTTNLVDHANKVFREKKIPKNFKTILPGYTRGLLFDLHYVLNGGKHTKDFEYYRINKKALNCSKNFSKCIRNEN
jgi:hypothetical protein